MHFRVLASGSSGNASLLQVDGFGVLIDLGLGPRTIAKRCAQLSVSWSHVHAALLTHTHGDHWSEATLRCLVRRRIPVHCHASHAADLHHSSEAFPELEDLDLVRTYEAGVEFVLPGRLGVRPLTVRHDAGVTCGFRFEWRGRSLGYATDLGCWDERLAGELANVQALALEFNHDVHMERMSGRGPMLIRRVLGDEGHLSNEQAAELVSAILRRSRPGRLRHLIQLHLSRQCNTPRLARAAAKQVLDEARHDVKVHTARQTQPGPVVRVPHADRELVRQGWLAGWEG